MFQELKKKCVQNSMWIVTTCFIFVAILFVIGFKGLIFMVTPSVSFSQMSTENIQKVDDKKVRAEIDLNYGTFMEAYTKQNGAETVTSYYYVILNYDEDDPRYMAVKLPTSYKKQMERLENYTYEGIEADAFTITGELCEMTDSEKKYFKKFFMEYNEFTSEEYEAETIPYIIREKRADFEDKIIAAAILICFLIAVFAVGIQMLGVGLKKIKKQIKTSGYDTSVIENDYETAGFSLKNNGFKIGRIASYCSQENKPYMFLNRDIVWAYQMTTSHSTNGIKTGTTYSLYIWDVNKKNYQIIMSESAVKDAMAYMKQHMPWVILGYSEELKRGYNKDYNNFLEALYNKVPHEFI